MFDRLAWLGVAASLVLPLSLRADHSAATLPLEDAIALPDQTIAFQESVTLTVPPLPAKPGRIMVLRFRSASFSEKPSGCNFNATVQWNDTYLGRQTVGGELRMVGRAAAFEFSELYPHEGSFALFGGNTLMILFAPEVDTADRMTKDGLGSWFALDISDVARGVDGNTLTIANIRQRSDLSERYDLFVNNLEIGYLDKSMLPKPVSLAPQRPPMSRSVTSGGITLALGGAGGFSVAGENGEELIIETTLGMDSDAPSDLLAQDDPPDSTAARITIEPFTKHGFRTRADWAQVKMVRTVEVVGEAVHWKERWTNTSGTITGVPFRHRAFLRRGSSDVYLSGDVDATIVASCAVNPTLFIASKQQAGRGLAVVAENDPLRLLMWLRTGGGVSEIYSETLALAPGASIDLLFTVAAVGHGGYWTFINNLRDRWGINGLTADRPFFFGYSKSSAGSTPDEVVAQSLGHLGPLYVAVSPWVRVQPDGYVVRSGNYAKLSADAEPAPGGCSDVDVDAYLTFAHREPYWKRFADEVEAIRRTCPQARIMGMMHPAMEVVYKPLADRWPIAMEAILTPQGRPFESATYSRAWLGDYVNKDWGIYYYVPRAGSIYLNVLLSDVRRYLDQYQVDGLYSDEFSWAGRRRDYSRYDYSRWDGYSADLDREGKVVRLKSDNALASESSQHQIAGMVVHGGRYFLGNGGAALGSLNAMPIHRFVEGGNGYGLMADAHLAPVPLVFGNFGDRTSLAGILEGVRTALSNGGIYSPTSAINLVLPDPDNVVCKLYPITVRRIGPGHVIGAERLVTSHDGSFDFPGRNARVRLYEYAADGTLVSKDKLVDVGAAEPLEIAVASGGLVIAEVIE